jgi:hypothetical protein
VSETIDLGWIGRTLRSVQTEQRALRAMIEPLAPRLAGLEARFSALDAPLGGIESMLDATFGGIQEQGRMLAERLDAAHRPAGPT